MCLFLESFSLILLVSPPIWYFPLSVDMLFSLFRNVWRQIMLQLKSQLLLKSPEMFRYLIFYMFPLNARSYEDIKKLKS